MVPRGPDAINRSARSIPRNAIAGTSTSVPPPRRSRCRRTAAVAAALFRESAALPAWRWVPRACVASDSASPDRDRDGGSNKSLAPIRMIRMIRMIRARRFSIDAEVRPPDQATRCRLRRMPPAPIANAASPPSPGTAVLPAGVYTALTPMLSWSAQRSMTIPDTVAVTSTHP